MIYYKAWYGREADRSAFDVNHPEWIVYAMDEGDAQTKVLRSIGLAEPERGYHIFLTAIPDEDDGTVAFATARQNGQALI